MREWIQIYAPPVEETTIAPIRDFISKYEPPLQALAIVIISIVAAFIVEFIIRRILSALAAKTETDLDDALVEILRRPIFISVVLYGLDWATALVHIHERLFYVVEATLETIAIVVWAVAAVRSGTMILNKLSKRPRAPKMLQPRTLPVFDMLMKILVLAGAFYFVFLAWDIDLTAWMASAGILGVAFGFAAKDTLANLFSGIFILADAAYKVDDWIVLDSHAAGELYGEEDLRGRVTHIGFRSTRLLTPDDVEVSVPNGVIGNALVLNENSGPPRQRVRIRCTVPFDADPTEIRATLTGAVPETSYVLSSPSPHARLRKLGEYGLEYELWFWIQEPARREQAIDEVTTRMFEALKSSGIGIAYARHDVFMREPPPRPRIASGDR